jgi:hypothetical protein
MHSTVALKINSEFECGPLGGTRIAGAAAKASSAPAFPKFLEKEIAARPAQVLAFNSPKLRGSRISKTKRDRDFQVVEAFVDVSYVLPLDGTRRTRRVLASLRVGDGQSRVNLRERLIAQAEEFFVLMVNACREDMFPLIRTH